MELTIRPAQTGEFLRVQTFYYDLIDDMQASEYHPMWQKGVYPTNEALTGAIGRGELYVTELEGRIIGAMIVNHSATDGYETVQWPTEAEPAEVTLIHALGVSPAMSRQGVASAMVREVKRIARAGGSKVIRLDVLEGNLPAERLYQGEGFRFVKKLSLFYPDTGWCSFDLYEFAL